jgi:hypothetical protein
MHDVTTSLKTSICFDGRKNNLGTYYAPTEILIDIGLCGSLQRSELFSGLGELLKNAALFGGEHALAFTEALAKAATDDRNGGSGEEFTLDEDVLLKLVQVGMKGKMDVLAQDAYEKTFGMVFEYGHTVSHAVEKAYGDGVVPHGVGVAHGMLCCSFISEKLGFMSAGDRELHDRMCHLLTDRWPLPEPRPPSDLVVQLALRDSKRGVVGENNYEIAEVLLARVGEVVSCHPTSLTKFPAELLKDWLESVGFAASTDQDQEEHRGDDQSGDGLPESTILDSVRQVVQDAPSSMDVRPLAGGFCADLHVVSTSDRRTFVAKVLQLEHLAMQLATAPSQILRNFKLAHSLGVGPQAYGIANNCLVMDFVAGRHPRPEDMTTQVVREFASITRRFHDSLPVEGTPFVWRWMNCMAAYVADGISQLGPHERDFAHTVLSEVQDTRAVFDDRELLLGFCHGNLKPLNVVVDGDHVQLIDFDASGCNYRGYDLMKFFRKDEPYDDHLFLQFLQEYAGDTWTVERLLSEARTCEPLTYLEPAIFFLFLAVKESAKSDAWVSKAKWRFAQYQDSVAEWLDR